MLRVEERGILQGILVCSNRARGNLQFADDTILFSRAREKDLYSLKVIIFFWDK